MSAPLWSRVPNPDRKCAGCKTRIGEWQILLRSTGKLTAFCGDCKTAGRHRASR